MGLINFTIARNAHKRPTLQHAVNPEKTSTTLCGVSIELWSRVYQAEPIPVLLCGRCKHHVASEKTEAVTS